MRVTLLVRLSPGPTVRAYLRAVDRPYDRMPVAGEVVMLDDTGELGGVVDQVTWDNAGTAVLRCTDPPVSYRWLLDAGFEQVHGTITT